MCLKPYYIIVLWQGENGNPLILDVDDQNITCVFASRGTQILFKLKSSSSKCRYHHI